MGMTRDERDYTQWRFERLFSRYVARASFEYSFDEAYAAFATRAYIPRTEHIVARSAHICAGVSERDTFRERRDASRGLFLLRNVYGR